MMFHVINVRAVLWCVSHWLHLNVHIHIYLSHTDFLDRNINKKKNKKTVQFRLLQLLHVERCQ